MTGKRSVNPDQRDQERLSMAAEQQRLEHLLHTAEEQKQDRLRDDVRRVVASTFGRFVSSRRSNLRAVYAGDQLVPVGLYPDFFASQAVIAKVERWLPEAVSCAIYPRLCFNSPLVKASPQFIKLDPIEAIINSGYFPLTVTIRPHFVFDYPPLDKRARAYLAVVVSVTHSGRTEDLFLSFTPYDTGSDEFLNKLTACVGEVLKLSRDALLLMWKLNLQ
jgi:hypothetical protein